MSVCSEKETHDVWPLSPWVFLPQWPATVPSSSTHPSLHAVTSEVSSIAFFLSNSRGNLFLLYGNIWRKARYGRYLETCRPRNSHQWSTGNKTPLRHSCLFLTYRSRAGNHGDHAQTLSQNRLLNNLFFREHFLNQRNPRDPRGYSAIGWKLLPFSKHSFWFRAFSQVML